jgi:hypothetical protein
LIKALPKEQFNHWSLCKTKSVGGEDRSYKNIIAYQWWNEEQHRIIVVNYSLRPSKAHVQIDNINYGNSKWQFLELLTEESYSYFGENLTKNGLYVELNPWKGQIFDVNKNY